MKKQFVIKKQFLDLTCVKGIDYRERYRKVYIVGVRKMELTFELGDPSFPANYRLVITKKGKVKQWTPNT